MSGAISKVKPSEAPSLVAGDFLKMTVAEFFEAYEIPEEPRKLLQVTDPSKTFGEILGGRSGLPETETQQVWQYVNRMFSNTNCYPGVEKQSIDAIFKFCSELSSAIEPVAYQNFLKNALLAELRFCKEGTKDQVFRQATLAKFMFIDAIDQWVRNKHDPSEMIDLSFFISEAYKHFKETVGITDLVQIKKSIEGFIHFGLMGAVEGLAGKKRETFATAGQASFSITIPGFPPITIDPYHEKIIDIQAKKLDESGGYNKEISQFITALKGGKSNASTDVEKFLQKFDKDHPNFLHSPALFTNLKQSLDTAMRTGEPPITQPFLHEIVFQRLLAQAKGDSLEKKLSIVDGELKNYTNTSFKAYAQAQIAALRQQASRNTEVMKMLIREIKDSARKMSFEALTHSVTTLLGRSFKDMEQQKLQWELRQAFEAEQTRQRELKQTAVQSGIGIQSQGSAASSQASPHKSISPTGRARSGPVVSGKRPDFLQQKGTDNAPPPEIAAS